MSMNPRQSRPGRIKSIGSWVIAISAAVLALVFLVRLTGDPTETVSWIGFVCFGLASAGSVVTIVLERGSR